MAAGGLSCVPYVPGDASGADFGGIFYVDSLSGENGPAPTLLDLQQHNVDLLVKGLSSPVPSTGE